MLKSFSADIIVALSQDIEGVALKSSSDTELQNGLKLLYCFGIISNGGLQSLYESHDPLVPFLEIPQVFKFFGDFHHGDIFEKANSLLLSPGKKIVASTKWKNKNTLLQLDQLQEQFNYQQVKLLLLDFSVRCNLKFLSVRRILKDVIK